MNPTENSRDTKASKKNPKKNPRSETGKRRSPDQEEILEDAGRIHDRDAMFGDGNRIVHGGSSADIDDTWDFERKDRLQGDVMQSSSAVDTQLQHVSGITDDVRQPALHKQPTFAKPAYEGEEWDTVSDEELMQRADALSIPQRRELNRAALIMKIREYESRH